MTLKILPFITVAISLLATLLMLTLLAAGCANMKPAQLVVMKWLALSVSGVALACVSGAVWTFVTGHYGWAAGIGGFPVVFIIVMLAVLIRIEF